MVTGAVRLTPGRPTADHTDLLTDAAAAYDDAGRRLRFAADWAPRLPRPGHGSTATLWEALAGLGAADLSLARTLEPHADALAILGEAGLPAPPAGTTWGVYAAEGPGTRLEAREDGAGRWRLDGTKPWCSLADQVSHALVTAWVGDRQRGLFAVALRRDDVRVEDQAWVSRGLAEIRSGPVTFDATPAEPVGPPGWYLSRNGFAWGGLGVAAIWYGGAVGVARRLRRAVRQREPDQLACAHLGAVDVALTGARTSLARAATAVDAGHADGDAGTLLALRVRGVVAAAVDLVLGRVDRALGPGPLTQDEDHARRVADLRVYVRQQHGERDDATLGRRLLDGPDPW